MGVGEDGRKDTERKCVTERKLGKRLRRGGDRERQGYGP